MSVLSIPLKNDLSEKIQQMISLGMAANKADFARKAIENYLEDLAVLQVLQSEQEVSEGKILRGDIDELAKSL